jgi:hypothetical protein
MSQERKMSKIEKRPDASRATPPAPLATELQVRIVCAGRSSAWVLDELSAGLRQGLDQGRDPLIVLEDLALLKDSVSTLLKGICKMFVGYPRTVTFWESSGYTEAFMSAMESPATPEDGRSTGGPPPFQI